jgi:LysM repeat protein
MPPGRLCAVLLVVVLTSPISVQTLPSRPTPPAEPVTVRVQPHPDFSSIGLPRLTPTRQQVASSSEKRPAQVPASRPTRAPAPRPRPVPPAVVRRSEPRRSTVYTVQPGDTLWALAQRSGVSVEDLQAANGLQSDRLRIGQLLQIPGGTRARIQTLRRVAFLWPARGTLTSRFGVRWRRHHNGIDIAARYGSPIRAVRAGVVRYSGWFGGYGRLVVIDHGGGLETWYGHAARLFVRPGQRVSPGQRIGAVGCSGACTGPHLHFEVRARGRPVDPMRYLR